MRKDDVDTKLKNFYDVVKDSDAKIVVERVFGISDLKYYINEIIEDFFWEYFTTRTLKVKVYEILRYDDVYDFLNTITKIHPIDLEMYYSWRDSSDVSLKLFTLDCMKWINRKLNLWVLDKKSGYRKKTKIFLQMNKDNSIVLNFKPDIKKIIK